MNINKTDITIPIMHCFDNNYVVPAAVSFYSMLLNASKEYNYKLFVLHSDITVQNQVKLMQIVQGFPNAVLEFIDMTDFFEDTWKEVKFTGHYTKEVLYKLLVPTIFQQYEKIIITDVDVVFLGDISPSYFSFDTEEGIYFAGVHQIMPKGSWLETYYRNYEENFGPGAIEQLKICGGYLVANLTQLRKYNMEEKFVTYLQQNAYRLLQSEQDVINFCCKNKEVKYLALNYVVCSYQYEVFDSSAKKESDIFYTKAQIQESMDKPVQLHYATGIKPWNDPTSVKADIWFYYLAQCGMFFDYMKKQLALQKQIPEYISNDKIRKGKRENFSPMIVSVLCCTYNHERFIRDTLESLVNQAVAFPYEIIVADDASTDSTRNIILEFCDKYPNLIVPILREKNVGIGRNYYDALRHVRGRFLAICDGDDCWIDSLKLKKQVDFLTKNVDYNICCSSCIKHHIESNEDILYNPEDYIKSAISIKDYYNFKDLLYCRFIASCTVMLRWQLRDMVPEFLTGHEVIDYPLTLIHAAGGRVKVMAKEIWGKYNIHNQGITSVKNDRVEKETFCIINEVNQFLDYNFSKTVENYFNDYKQYIAGVQKYEKEKEFEKARQDQLKLKKENFRTEMQIVPKTKKHIIYDLLCLLYRECVPEVIKRIWRLAKFLPVLLYRECIPNILKRGYRVLKRKLRRC